MAKRSRAREALFTIVVLIILFLVVAPILQTVFISFKTNRENFSVPASFWPRKVYFGNYFYVVTLITQHVHCRLTMIPERFATYKDFITIHDFSSSRLNFLIILLICNY